jgi:hypothetical protein
MTWWWPVRHRRSCAAIQAARNGASVLLVEETDWIGGQMNAARRHVDGRGRSPRARPAGSTAISAAGSRRTMRRSARPRKPPTFSAISAWSRTSARDPRDDDRGGGADGPLEVVLDSRIAEVRRRGTPSRSVRRIRVRPPRDRLRMLIDATEWAMSSRWPATATASAIARATGSTRTAPSSFSRGPR